MPTSKNDNINSILTNPAGHLKKIKPTASRDTISKLRTLHHDYIELKEQSEAAQARCKKTSRQIGKAKQSGEPIDSLLKDMRTYSTDAKNLSSMLNDITADILKYFDTPGSTEDQPQPETNLPRTRVYTAHPANRKVTIKILDNDHEAWNKYVESNPAASIYHRAEWRHLIEDLFGHRGYYFIAQDTDNKTTGILPLIRMQSRLFGDFLVSMPYFNYGGAIADTKEIELRLIQAANHLAGDIGVNHVEYRDDVPRAGMPVKCEKVNMILPLPYSREELWDGFSSKLRAQIRRPQREDIHTRRGGEECLDDFYAVFARNMRDLGTPVYSKDFFRSILQRFPEQSRIIAVYMNGKAVSAGFLLGHKETLEIPWASTIRDVNHLSMNMLLYWEVLTFAIENKYRYFDFGRSSKSSGTFKFKQQWGAIPKQSYWHYWLANDTRLPELNPDNSKYALAINIWKQLPVGVTTWLGPHIVKNLP